MDCSHFTKDIFQPETVVNVISELQKSKLFCHDCAVETDSRWICLGCGIIQCGRFEKGHARAHYETKNHFLALDLISKACHWYFLNYSSYKCDEYVRLGECEDELDLLRKKITEIISGVTYE